MEKLCIFCKHMDIDMGWPGTDVTAGDSATIECLKGHWHMTNFEGVDEYRKNIIAAESCPDYTHYKLEGPA